MTTHDRAEGGIEVGAVVRSEHSGLPTRAAFAQPVRSERPQWEIHRLFES
jgi:hypothetical protein